MKRTMTIGLALVLVFGFSALGLAGSGCPKTCGSGEFQALNNFHTTLAEVWHTHYPANDYTAMRNAAPVLVEKFNTLKTAELPSSQKAKAALVEAQIEKLGETIDALATVAKDGSDEAVAQSVSDIHEQYHALKKIFHPSPEDKK